MKTPILPLCGTLALALAGLLPLAAAAQGTVQSPNRPLLPSDVEALGRYAQRGPATTAQTNGLLAAGAIGVEQIYFDPEWAAGSLALSGQPPQPAAGLRLNLLEQSAEVRDNAVPGGIARYPLKKLDALTCGTHRFEVLDYRGNAGGGRGFLEFVTPPGRLRLLLLPEAEFVPAVRNDALALEVKPAYYRRSTRLFALAPGRTVAAELALNQRQVLRLMGDQNKIVQDYALAHSLGYASVTDVARLVEFYNTLPPTP